MTLTISKEVIDTPNRHQKRTINKFCGGLKQRFVNKTYTLEMFYSDIMSVCDLDPVGQRPPVVHLTDNKKYRDIIESMFSGIDIGKITLNENEDTSYKLFESVDGGHRKRAIRRFISNLFPIRLNGKLKKFKDLSQDEMNYFFSYEIIVAHYLHLTNAEKSALFQTINLITPVNHQQKMNAMGDTPFANLVRGLVRTFHVRGVYFSNVHPLFSKVSEEVNKKTGQLKFKNAGQLNLISKQNNTLAVEEFVARILVRIFDTNELGSKSDKDIAKLYNTDFTEKQIQVATKTVTAQLDFLYEMARIRKDLLKKPMTWNEMNCLSNIYFYLNEEYRSWTLGNPVEFFKVFKKSYSFRMNGDKKENKVPHNLSYETSGTDIAETFKNYNTCNQIAEDKDYPNTTKVALRQSMEWIFDKDIEGGIHTAIAEEYIIALDTRLFSTAQKEEMMIRQDYICAVDGMSLRMEDAEAHHVIPHSKGGKTIVSNGVMVRAKYNKQMSNKLSIQECRDLNGITFAGDLTESGII